MLLLVFTLTMFVSAGLLFLVEPMIAKMLLPSLGGTPAVWNTCMVFFQVMLLAGYLYAYAATRWLGRRSQMVVHIGMATVPLAVLPIHFRPWWQPPAGSTPVFWLLGILAVSVGLPFFALASSTPVLQRWFGSAGHPQSADPYFLYAASNVGSLAGLMAYPFAMEPMLRLSEQAGLWRWGYVGFVTCTVACAALVWNAKAELASLEFPKARTESVRGIWRRRLGWVALAFVPSSLMIGVTTALTTDVPAIPLFWVMPLALYLVSFILVFAKRQVIAQEWIVRRLPFLILAALVPEVSQTKLPLLAMLVLYLGVLFGVAMMCHGELARSRPGVGRLTEFYVWISVGGVLGGVFNSLIAPMVFRTVLEFPLVLIAAALLRPSIDVKPLHGAQLLWAKRKDWLLPLALAVVMLAAILLVGRMGMRPGRALNIALFGSAMFWCLSFGKRPVRFAVGVAALVAASSIYPGSFGRVVHAERSFFGVSRVTEDAEGRFRYLFHGGTAHGIERTDAAESREPLAYYTKSGPAGSILRGARGEVAVVGLGAGALACDLQPGQKMTFYEIDPSVVRIATNTRYFKFLSGCAPEANVVMGDARLRLQHAPDEQYGLIVLDAFSGDSIPMHLVTREALAMYRRKLAPGGMIAFHVSNLYLDLAPTLGGLAEDAGMVARMEDDSALSADEVVAGKFPSRWLIMTQSEADLARLSGRWVIVQGKPGARVWTDDYSNLFSVMKWR